MTSSSLARSGSRHGTHARGDAMHPRALPTRLWPQEAYAELLIGDSTLVDIRQLRDRLGEGEVDHSLGAVHLDVAQLEGLFDRSGPGSIPEATYAARLVLLGQDGSDSARAVELLHRLGAAEVADVIGGYDAWRRAGLPISPWPEPGL